MNTADELAKAVKLFQRFFDEMPKGQLGGIVCDWGILNDAFLQSGRALKMYDEEKPTKKTKGVSLYFHK